MIGGRSYTSLRGLALTVTFELEEATAALMLRVSPELFGRTIANLGTPRPSGMIYRQDPSLFLNYALQWIDFQHEAASLELGAALGGGLLLGSAFREPDGRWVRGLTSLLYDYRPALARLVVGDRPVSLGSLGGNFILGGVNVSREFSLDPYLLRSPGWTLSGSVATPATADIYINGLLARRQSLAPGPFELRNLPVLAGSGAVTLVLRDPFGREQVIVGPVYGTVSLLAPGLQEWSYGIGLHRENLARLGRR
jgi:outer membrane usher protein